VLNNINKMRLLFESVQILVFYDNSTDESLKILNEYKNKYKNMEIIINNCKISQHRVENIAFARNAILERIREKYGDYEYFIMMDSNEYSCIGDINLEVITSVLSRDDWDAISFDREAGYYDTWALSFEPYMYSFFHFTNWNKVVNMMRDEFSKLLADYKNNKPDELIPVYSAFNGFSIYKTDKFVNCKYDSKINLSLFPRSIIEKEQEITGCNIIHIMEGDCEHRHFHLESIQKNNARIRISTKSVFSKVGNSLHKSRGPY
jgi:glycosyltransferase involved in cell wall biosynthesis